jgi:predicted O-methyltransferase YrrM
MDVLEKHIHALHNIILNSGELLEGNCFYYHQTLQISPELQSKQRNLLRASFGKKHIMEIGFNAGHSLLLFLLNAPTATYTVFDICEHKYTRPCFEYLRTAFPDAKLTLIAGDSTITVPNYSKENPNASFDLIHVDGGHLESVAYADMTAAIQLCATNGILILDDTQDPLIAAIGQEYQQRGYLEPTHTMEETHMYQHQVYTRTSQK